jgi:hypothetical protein
MGNEKQTRLQVLQMWIGRSESQATANLKSRLSAFVSRSHSIATDCSGHRHINNKPIRHPNTRYKTGYKMRTETISVSSGGPFKRFFGLTSKL